MKAKVLGKTGITVSEIGFGGIPIIPLDFEHAAQIVRLCFEKGITFFDTANIYGDSEKKIGLALSDVRDKIVLASKTLERDAQSAHTHVNLSLKNLNTEVIDLYQLHNISKKEDMEKILDKGGALEGLNQAKSEGKINHIGFSSHDIRTAKELCQTGLFSTIQFPFNFIEMEPADDLFKVAKEQNMGIIGMKPLGGGLLEKARLCFGFLQNYPDVIPIPGIATSEEADEIVNLYKSPQPLENSDIQEIEKIRTQLGKRFCHRCGYCMPCEQGVNITEALSFRPMLRRLTTPIATIISEAAIKSVDNCIECDECLDKCPYTLPIPDLIRENQKMYNDIAEQED